MPTQTPTQTSIPNPFLLLELPAALIIGTQASFMGMPAKQAGDIVNGIFWLGIAYLIFRK